MSAATISIYGRKMAGKERNENIVQARSDGEA